MRVRPFWIQVIGAFRKQYGMDGTGYILPDYTSPCSSMTVKDELGAGWRQARRHKKDKRVVEVRGDERGLVRRLAQSIQQFLRFHRRIVMQHELFASLHTGARDFLQKGVLSITDADFEDKAFRIIELA
eukprot:2698167-Pyramimonas_sp.AAC.1